ncbi:MAG: amidohydrolase [Saprospiraceae bacterium]|nr:amidohydrolase [Saprospiraceae bacterium]
MKLIHAFQCLILLLLAASLSAQPSALPKKFPAALASALPELDSLYRELHQHPEPSGAEIWTSATLANEMRRLGYEVHDSIGGYGLVCILRNGPGDTILYRTDMDALEIRECTGLPYASRRHVVNAPGDTTWYMHACSHNMHMAVWVGTARMMAQFKSHWRGTLLCVAQPSEENGAGAKAMLDAGLYQRFPRPHYAVALHDDAALEAGKVAVVAGPAMAHTTSVDVDLYGRSAHGGYPHLGLDVIVLGARCILDFQTIISRELKPGTPAVITVGKIEAGTRRNQLPDHLHMELTLRTYDDSINSYLIRRIREICEYNALSARVPDEQRPTVRVIGYETPTVRNDTALTARAKLIFEKALGKNHVVQKTPVMGGEDFSRYGMTSPPIPTMLYWLGTVSAEDWSAAKAGRLVLPSLHSSRFAPDRLPTLRTGVTSMTALLLGLMK